jgi:hypothetical protein
VPTWNSVHFKYLAFFESAVDFRLLSNGCSVTVCLDLKSMTRMFVLSVSASLTTLASMTVDVNDNWRTLSN